MSLTGFNRLRRMKQEEAMKPENIGSSEEAVIPIEPQTVVVEEPKVEEKPVEIKEEKKPTARRRTTRRN